MARSLRATHSAAVRVQCAAIALRRSYRITHRFCRFCSEKTWPETRSTSHPCRSRRQPPKSCRRCPPMARHCHAHARAFTQTARRAAPARTHPLALVPELLEDLLHLVRVDAPVPARRVVETHAQGNAACRGRALSCLEYRTRGGGLRPHSSARNAPARRRARARRVSTAGVDRRRVCAACVGPRHQGRRRSARSHDPHAHTLSA